MTGTLPLRLAKAKCIVEDVAREHGLYSGDLYVTGRAAHIVAARGEAIRRVERETQLTLKQIGRLFGGLDHSSVIHHLRNGAKDAAAAASRQGGV